VLHGHITLNGRKTNIPSCQIKPGDVIAWREASTKTEYFKRVVQQIQSKTIPSWLSLDIDKLSGRVLGLPTRSDIGAEFDEKSVVEYYSR
jgi:small subunit ribosomal protein S4